MHLILIVLLFVVWETWSPGAARFSVLSSAAGFSTFVAGYAVVIVAVRIWANRFANRLLAGEVNLNSRRISLLPDIARFFIPGWFAVAVFGLGWHQTVTDELLPGVQNALLFPGTALGLMPALLAWMGLWWAQFPMDRTLREYNTLQLLESDLPVFMPGDFLSYFLNKLRVQLLFVLAPASLILLLHDGVLLSLAKLAGTAIGRSIGIPRHYSDSLDSAVATSCSILVMVFAPSLLRHVLHTIPLPESRLRRSLVDIARNTGINCRQILLWRTQNNLGNAAVMGLIPQVRFVMLSDLLLESMTDLQIQAVFAHELGHVRHRHLLWLFGFFGAVGGLVFSITGWLEDHLHLTDGFRDVYDIASVVMTGGLILVGFGLISRRFERQADVFAARTIQKWGSDPDADHAGPHTIDFGAEAFASALERVALVNNIPVGARNWTHGSIAARVGYIRRFARDPAEANAFDRRTRWLFIALLATIAAGITVTAFSQL